LPFLALLSLIVAMTREDWNRPNSDLARRSKKAGIRQTIGKYGIKLPMRLELASDRVSMLANNNLYFI
jgi:hypothetical protein